MKKILDGNKAAALNAYLFSEVAAIYPITPSSTMASEIELLKDNNKKNLFHESVKIEEMQSEAGAAGAMHGALLTGSLATTFTASQGLLLMIPNMYKMAGECLPGVIHVASRTIATHALSIFGDHSDIYAVRDTGFCILASSSVEDAYYMSIVAHLAAIKGSLPFVHFFDGFRTSHEINVIDGLDDKDILNLINKDALNKFKERALNVGKAIQYGMSETEDIYFQSVEARNKLYEDMPNIVNDYMVSINKLAHTNYKPFTYYGDEKARFVVVSMGSVSDTIKLVIDKENRQGGSYGLVEVHLYRPFSKKYFLDALPKTCEIVTVLSRVKNHGSMEPLYLDVLNVLKDKKITVLGGHYGLSGKDTTPSDIYSVLKMMEENPVNDFSLGIVDDVTNKSLKPRKYELDMACVEAQIFGFGSDGMVTCSKDILNILGNNYYVQGYFAYDSKKSGGVTVSHLRYGKDKIKAPFYVTNSKIIVVTKASYFKEFSLLDTLVKGGTLIVNSKDTEFLNNLTLENYENIKNKNIKLFIVDADGLADLHQIPGKISMIMEAIILNMLGITDYEEILVKRIKEKFISKGEDIVNNNILAIKDAIKNVYRIEQVIGNSFEDKSKDVFDVMKKRCGNLLKVSECMSFANGAFPGGNSKREKGFNTTKVPKWNKDYCIQCGMCSFVCPHGVIRPFLTDKDIGLKELGKGNNNFIISVSEQNCTGCGLCIEACPGKNGHKSLEFGSPRLEKQQEFNYYEKNNKNDETISTYTVKGSQLLEPKFKYSGACAGCGEASYIKLMTQLYGDNIVIANATGCSSIYGGSTPYTPYSIPWANSLFEDNAEFALGMHLSYQNKQKRIKNIMEGTKELVTSEVKELFCEYLENYNDYKKTREIKNKLENMEIPYDLRELLNYVPARTVVAVGGDGWAYDIGFGGLDHVLHSNENIKILVLDTEVYSNTGGQASKSTRLGAVAEFTNMGKKTQKKDLFRYAMGIPNVYVASVSLGASPMQTIRAFKEAMEHVGPSLLICYSPCIEQGIKNGMTCSLEEQKLAIESGYNLLMRYDGTSEILTIDSKEPDFGLYEELLNKEVRYKALKIKDENLASELLKMQKDNAIKLYKYYENLVKK